MNDASYPFHLILFIPGDYEMLNCSRLPYKDLGFNDVYSFMKAIPDVATETRCCMFKYGNINY